MKFYTEIANYYDEIFNNDIKKTSFLKKLAGVPPKNILDIACGTGQNAIKLSDLGHIVTAIDLNRCMIDILKSKNLKVNSYVMNMLHIDNLNSTFDMIYCIGNSLVHLESEEDISIFFKKVYNSLSSNGIFSAQILNYDRVLNNNIKSLPSIINKERGIVFERYYKYDKFRDKIEFEAILKTQVNEMSSKVYLLPLKFDTLKNLLEKNSFKNISFYGSFEEDPFNIEESFNLIFKCTK